MQKNYDLLTGKFQEIKDNLRRYLEGQLEILSHDDFSFESSSELLSSLSIPEMQLSSDLGSEEDNEETKINMKLQEIMVKMSKTPNIVIEKAIPSQCFIKLLKKVDKALFLIYYQRHRNTMKNAVAAG